MIWQETLEPQRHSMTARDVFNLAATGRDNAEGKEERDKINTFHYIVQYICFDVYWT